MDSANVFTSLLHAESEDEVLHVLEIANLMNAANWRYLGGIENNFGIVANQQQDATGAFVEKIVNALDANLMRACFDAGIDPEGPDAPTSMAGAVEMLFHVPKGRIGDLQSREQRELAELTRVVATGSKTSPCYLIVDRGEGQTPASMPDTFLSLAKSNKMRIPFVQGKFNAGGTGVLPFCGQHNIQLIASRRNEGAPVDATDDTKDLWGFTIVRRLRPADGRRNSVYVYLAPGGSVPSFAAPAIDVLPSPGKPNQPDTPYSLPIESGSVVKLYDYRWGPKSTATTEMRYELERFLHSPCLPFRVVETRAYRANYYSASVIGVWAALGGQEDSDESTKVESGFPGSAVLSLKGIGTLPYVIALFTEDTNTRRVPHGVHFVINGQSHGQLASDFIKRIGFSYLEDDVLVSVDCTYMDANVREDFFMASRDRLRRNETYYTVVDSLEKELRDHPGLREANAVRRAKRLEQSLQNQEDVTRTFNDLLSADPALQALFNLGDRLVSTVGPAETEKYEGKRFPTYFKIEHEPKAGGLTKPLPANRTCRVEFVTDAANDYFDRVESPGELTISPSDVLEHGRLWNGVYSGRFRPPSGAQRGDSIEVALTVTDPSRAMHSREPFVSKFLVKVEEATEGTSPPGALRTPKDPEPVGKKAPRLALPNVASVRKTEWADFKPAFDEEIAFRVIQGDEGAFDFFVNLDCRHLLGYLKATKDEEKELVIYWFKWGLTLCSLGLLHGFGLIGKPTSAAHVHTNESAVEQETDETENPIETVNQSVNGIASVIIPIIRNLYHPLAVAAV